ncbi:TetR/AcrR family transcriptional regulator [Kineococcus sp. NUM-3379]
MPTPARRSYHHGDLRSALLVRAEEVVRARGSAALSLRELARDLGVSHAAPSRHFPDRDALLDALAVHGFQRLGATMAAAAAPPAPFTERLVAVGQAYLDFSVHDAELLGLMFTAKHARGATPALWEAAGRALRVVEDVVADGRTAGVVAPGEEELATAAVLSTVHGIASLAASGMLPGARAHDVLASSLGLLAGGLGARVPAPPPAR